MRYLNERMSIDAYKRLHSAFVGSFEDLMKSRGGSPDEGADNALGYFNALLNGYGEALVNGNWINYDSKTRRNERIRQKNKAKKIITLIKVLRNKKIIKKNQTLQKKKQNQLKRMKMEMIS